MSQQISLAEEAPYARFGIPRLGFRNYWYPALPARDVGRTPKAVKLLGEDIVLYRDAGRVFALEDRCPHRGVKLSPGKCQFAGSGTISCPYHGWTFDGKTGALVAALMEGPDSTIIGKVHVKAYPVEERAGLVWVFVGDMAAPPLTDDLPEFIADPARFFSLSVYSDYEVNWRYLVDNWAQDHHGPYVHRNSPELYFQPMLPFAQEIVAEPLESGNGLAVRALGGVRSAEFPGLGTWPGDAWRRFMKPSGRGNMVEFSDSKAARVYGIKHLIEVRLPGLVVVGRQSGEYNLVQWAVPIDERRVRLFNINNFRKTSRWREAFDRVHYVLWRRWAHDAMFSDQDKRVIEATVPGPERLSRTDVGVIAWRKFAGGHARRPPDVATPSRHAG